MKLIFRTKRICLHKTLLFNWNHLCPSLVCSQEKHAWFDKLAVYLEKNTTMRQSWEDIRFSEVAVCQAGLKGVSVLEDINEITNFASWFSLLMLRPVTKRCGLFERLFICVQTAVILSLFCASQSETSWEDMWITPDSVCRVCRRLMMEVFKVVQGLWPK